MSSVLFNNTPSSRPNTSHHLANYALSNLQDAQDTSVTALPQPPTTATTNAKPTEEGFWKRILARIKNSLLFKWGEKEKKDLREEESSEREMCIGEPTGFEHVETSGPRPLMGTIPVIVEEEEEEESEWEDMEQSEAGRDSTWIKR